MAHVLTCVCIYIFSFLKKKSHMLAFGLMAWEGGRGLLRVRVVGSNSRNIACAIMHNFFFKNCYFLIHNINVVKRKVHD